MAWAPKWRIAACELKRRTRTRDVRHRPRGTASEGVTSLWPLGAAHTALFPFRIGHVGEDAVS